MNTVNDILNNISSLPEDEQFFIIDILNKRMHDLKRLKIKLRAKEAEDNYKSGQCVTGNVDDLMKMLNDD